MREVLAKKAAGIFFLAMAMLVVLPAAGTIYEHDDTYDSDRSVGVDLEVAQEYADALSEGRDNLQPEEGWLKGSYNNSLDYVEAGRYYVGFYEIEGKVAWVSVVDLDAFWYYRADVSWDHFIDLENDPAAVIGQAVREDGLAWGRNNTISDPSWPAGTYDNSTADFADNRYIVKYLVNGTAERVSIANMDDWYDWYNFHDSGNPTKASYQVDMTIREFEDSQQYSRG